MGCRFRPPAASALSPYNHGESVPHPPLRRRKSPQRGTRPREPAPQAASQVLTPGVLRTDQYRMHHDRDTHWLFPVPTNRIGRLARTDLEKCSVDNRLGSTGQPRKVGDERTGRVCSDEGGKGGSFGGLRRPRCSSLHVYLTPTPPPPCHPEFYPPNRQHGSVHPPRHSGARVRGDRARWLQ